MRCHRRPGTDALARRPVQRRDGPGAIAFVSAPSEAMPRAGEGGQAPSCPSRRRPRHRGMGRDGAGPRGPGGAAGARPEVGTRSAQQRNDRSVQAPSARLPRPRGAAPAPLPPDPRPAGPPRPLTSALRFHSESSVNAPKPAVFTPLERYRGSGWLLVMHERVPVPMLLQRTRFHLCR